MSRNTAEERARAERIARREEIRERFPSRHAVPQLPSVRIVTCDRKAQFLQDLAEYVEGLRRRDDLYELDVKNGVLERSRMLCRRDFLWVEFEIPSADPDRKRSDGARVWIAPSRGAEGVNIQVDSKTWGNAPLTDTERDWMRACAAMAADLNQGYVETQLRWYRDELPFIVGMRPQDALVHLTTDAGK